jgi:hypothetical protein
MTLITRTWICQTTHRRNSQHHAQTSVPDISGSRRRSDQQATIRVRCDKTTKETTLVGPSKSRRLKTLEFLETYAPALLATSLRIAGYGTLITTVAAAAGTTLVDTQTAGYLSAAALESRHIWEIMNDIKDFLTTGDDLESESAQQRIEKQEQTVRELTETVGELSQANTDLVNTNAALGDNLEHVLESSHSLLESNGQLQSALRQHYTSELSSAQIKGLIESVSFDFDREGTIVQYEEEEVALIDEDDQSQSSGPGPG